MAEREAIRFMEAAGDDHLYGEADSDVLAGEGGNDILDGGSEDDILWGGTLVFGLEVDQSFTWPNLPTVITTSYGGDSIPGSPDDGRDTLRGGTGQDFLFGGGDEDQLFGQDGNDYLDGGAGRDTVRGEDGTDYLRRSAGRHLVWRHRA